VTPLIKRLVCMAAHLFNKIDTPSPSEASNAWNESGDNANARADHLPRNSGVIVKMDKESLNLEFLIIALRKGPQVSRRDCADV